MRIAIILLALAALPAFAGEDTRAFVQRALTQMNNPRPQGNASLYETYLDPDCLYVQENDTISTKAQMIAGEGPAPKDISVHIDVEILNFHEDGDTAIAVARDHETESFFGQTLHATYLYTTTWRHRADGWKLLLEQVLAEPIDPPSIALPAAALPVYAGTYKLKDSDMTYVVALTDSGLTGNRPGRSPAALQAEASDVFFI